MRDSISWASRTAVNKKSVIEFYCKSGRHRSVGISTIISYSFEVNLLHQSAWTWREMDSRDNEEFIELMKPWVRKFNLEIASGNQARIEQNLEGDATVATVAPSSSGVRRPATWTPAERVPSVETRAGEPVSLVPRAKYKEASCSDVFFFIVAECEGGGNGWRKW